MALIVCKECKKEFSTDAKCCPHCGARNASGFLKSILISFVGLIVFIILVSIARNFDKKSASSNPIPSAQKSPQIVSTQKTLENKIEWSEKPSLPSFKNEVAFDIKFYDFGDKKPIIIGYTNLPEGTDIMVSVSRKKIGYFGDTKTTVKDGRFQTKHFDASNMALPSGEYKIEISTPLPDFEPESVREIIGKKGENLKGKWVKQSYSSKTVNYSTNLRFGSGESKQDDADAIKRKKDEQEQDLNLKLAKIPDAQLMCQQFVKDKLHDPSAAEFDDYKSFPVEFIKKRGVYKVQVHLRARNAFNALRSGVFECETMQWSSEKWLLMKLRQID